MSEDLEKVLAMKAVVTTTMKEHQEIRALTKVKRSEV
jgi:hypothetical protein